MQPSRKSSRLTGYDYALPGAYFVTICTHGKLHSFGNIHNGRSIPSSLGQLAADLWRRLPTHHSNIQLGAWVVMPNHMHGIVMITKPLAGSLLTAASSLSSGVGGFKSAVSREGARLGICNGPVWHPRFYDHIIRHERALERVQDYIINNPLKWSLDRENSEREGLNEFYGWMDNYSRLTIPGKE